MPALQCRALHFSGKPVEVIARFSNGGGLPERHDNAPDVRGMAVSFRLPDGTATDLLGQTAPRFPVRTPEAFVQLVEASQDKKKLAQFVWRHRDALPALVANARAKSIVAPHSYAEATYYPIHAYKWLAPDGAESWVRYRMVPLAEVGDRLDAASRGRHRLAEELAERVAAGPVRFTLSVQFAHAGDDPHDPMSVWGKDARHLDAGTIEITAPDPDREADGKVMVFDPARIVDGIELSDDPILRFRPAAYSASVDRRLST